MIARARFSLWLGVAAFVATLFAAPAAEARRKKRRRAHAALSIERPAPQPSAEPPALLPDAARAYQASYDHEMAGRFVDAVRDLDDLPAAERESYLGRLRRGWLLYRAGRHGESIAAYRQAIAIEKGSVEARVGGLLPLIALKQWTEVEQGARAALDLDPANYLAGVRLAFAVSTAAAAIPRPRPCIVGSSAGIPATPTPAPVSAGRCSSKASNPRRGRRSSRPRHAAPVPDRHRGAGRRRPLTGYPVIECEYKAGHQFAPTSGAALWSFFSQF